MNVSIKKKKTEALRRMKELGIYGETIHQFDKWNKISLSVPPFGAFFWLEGEDLERMKEFEKRYNALVFVVIRTYTTIGTMDSFLFVSDNPEEWADDHKALKDGEAIAYVYNYDAPDCSEIGFIGIELTIAAGLRRTW